MNNNQPLQPQTSLLDAKQQGRSRVKVAVFSVLALHVAGLTTLLLTQGCKREVPVEEQPQPELPVLMDDTNAMYYTETNLPPDLPPLDDGYLPPQEPPVGTPSIPDVPPPSPLTTEYVVKSGDTFTSIARDNGTTVKAIQEANPTVDPRRLQIGQKLVLPPPAPAGVSTPAPAPLEANVYVVKSGDTLSRIAKNYNTTVKELKSINGLLTDRINVGQKLKLPPPPEPVPITEPPPAVPLDPVPAN